MRSLTQQQMPLWDERPSSSGWAVRRSLRARRMAVRVFRDGGVEIVAPAKARPEHIEAFVGRHRDWIERNQRRHAPVALAFPPGSLELPAVGERWLCHAVPLGGAVPKRARFLQEQPAGAVGGGTLQWPAIASEARQRERLLAWLVQRAARAFEAPLRAQAAAMGLAVRQVQVRRQRTRWGSCSARGTISLNVCLLFQPPEVVHYLFVHELTHLRHMNHSARFWDAVAGVEPRWRELDRELARGWQRVPGWVLAALRA